MEIEPETAPKTEFIKKTATENNSNDSGDGSSSKNPSFIKRITGNNSKKQKPPVPVPEASVDNWFFKNFGLSKLFEDEEDQPMR